MMLFYFKLLITTSIVLSLSTKSKYLSSTKPIFVAGGSKGLGLDFVKLLSELSIPVKALVRSKEAQAMLSQFPGVTAIQGDAFDEAAVQSTMEGCVAAVSTLGGIYDEKEAILNRVDYAGNSNVIEQAGILGVERILLITSVGCGSTKNAVSEEVYRLLKASIEAKNNAERDLKMYTNLDWTIIRPGALQSKSPTGSAILTEDNMATGVINRADLASLMVKVLGTNGLCTRREFTALDPSIKSPSRTPVTPFLL